MKNDSMKRALERELENVRVSRELKERILAEAAVSRAPAKKNGFSIRPLAIAAAVMVTFGLSAGMIALRTENPDISTTPLSVNNASQSVWAGSDGMYHGKNPCGDQKDMRSTKPEDARAEGLKACSKCFEPDDKAVEKLVWMTKAGIAYHAQPDCSGMDDAVGVLEIEAKTLGREKCMACLGGNAVESWPMRTAEPEGNVHAYVTPEATVPPRMTPTPMPAQTAGIIMAKSTPEPTPRSTPEPTLTPRPTPEPMLMPTPRPTPEPTPVPADSSAADEEIFWMPEKGSYYHSDEYCASYLTVEEFIDGGKAPCAECGAEDLEDAEKAYSNDEYYHAVRECAARTKYQPCEVSQVKVSGCTPCPLCMREEYEKLHPYYNGNVWLTDDGVYYHRARNCMGTKDAYERVRGDAMQMGKQACPECMDEEPVWTDGDHDYYHRFETCPYMRKYESDSFAQDKREIAEAAAMEEGKRPCPMCLFDKAGSPIAEMFILAAEAEQLDVLTAKDACYHVNELCPGIETNDDGFTVVDEITALKWGKVPCSECMPQRYEQLEEVDYAAIGEKLSAGDLWMTEDGMYYHTDMTCSDMRDASPCDVISALRAGKLPCPECARQLAEVWVTATGHEYHLSDDCMGIVGAEKLTGSEAVGRGLTICEKCHAELIDGLNQAE